MNQFVKQAYVQGLAARAILRARIMQKRAGIGDYAMAGGVGAGGGAFIGALINYARKKNMLSGALAGAGIGGVAGLGYQGVKDLLSKKTPGYRGAKSDKYLFPLIESSDENALPARAQELILKGGIPTTKEQKAFAEGLHNGTVDLKPPYEDEGSLLRDADIAYINSHPEAPVVPNRDASIYADNPMA